MRKLPNIKIKGKLNREIFSTRVDTQQVLCPHCGNKNDIIGMGQWKCGKCQRQYSYDGPFQGICNKCKKEIEINPVAGTTHAFCPHCGQEYNFDIIIPSESACVRCLEGCASCGPLHC